MMGAATAKSKKITAAQVCDAIARCQGSTSGATPDEQEVAELVYWINRYQQSPWTSVAVARYRDAHRERAKKRATLDAAAEMVEEELRYWQDYCVECNEPWEEGKRDFAREKIADRFATLRVLRAQLPLDGVRPLAAKGSNPKGYSLVAQKLASETLLALQAAQRRMGHAVQRTAGGKDGPLVRAVGIWLHLIYGRQFRLSQSTLFDIVEKTIAPYKR